MTLNKKRTLLIAFAFFCILMLWRVYYFYVPLYLDNLLINRFGYKGDDHYKDIIGHIMSLDNLSAICIIPLFSFLSDKTRTRHGKRMPYIVWGMVASLVLFPLIAVMYIYNAFAWYFVVVVLLIIAMAAFRSPAVSLMPDITPKPLRTPANAIINFVGYIGAILGAGLTIVFTMKHENLTLVPFFATSIVMMVVICLLLLRFNENKVLREVEPQIKQGELESETINVIDENQKLAGRDKVNFWIMFAVIFLCWFAFTALDTFASLYGKYIGTESIGICTTVLAVTSFVTFLPSVWVSKHLGRKWTVILGFSIVVVSLIIGSIFVRHFGILIILLFAANGIGWALAMVNSYPMFVEMSHSKNVARMTSIYYVVSQGSMFVTSNVAGYVFKWFGMGFYFNYAIIFMSLAVIMCLFFKVKKATRVSADKL